LYLFYRVTVGFMFLVAILARNNIRKSMKGA